MKKSTQVEAARVDCRLAGSVRGAVIQSEGVCRTSALAGTMRWYGWGDERVGFDPAGRPHIWPFAKKHLGISEHQKLTRPVALETIVLPGRRDNAGFMARVAEIFPPSRWSIEDFDRLLHAYGKSARDLWRIRHGRVDFAPDYIVYPDSEDEICQLLEAADRHGVAVIPFGGGSNVTGCLEPHRPDPRMVCVVNLRGMNRVREVDPISRTARIEAGILGPDLEDALATHDLALGHVPDSFPHSTLGGWVASRSAGMYSDGYGNIEDMVVSLRIATPGGMVRTLDVPRASTGPDLNSICIGSEGTLGIITEVTVCVRKTPGLREFQGYLFPSFEAGMDALRECRSSGHVPVLSRLHDGARTQLSAAFRQGGGRMHTLAAGALQSYIKLRGFDPAALCLLLCAYEGEAASEVRARRRPCEKIFRSFGAIKLGRSPGRAFLDDKFAFPYIRDFLMDYDVICDVNETATTWSQLKPLYRSLSATFDAALRATGRPYWFGCHISHTYHSGAMLYFSFAFRGERDAEGRCDWQAELAHYLAVKRAVLDGISANGATVSHHHAVGYEHLPWLPREGGMGRGTAVEGMKSILDPHDIMNPGKLVSGFSLEDWFAGPQARAADGDRTVLRQGGQVDPESV